VNRSGNGGKWPIPCKSNLKKLTNIIKVISSWPPIATRERCSVAWIVRLQTNLVGYRIPEKGVQCDLLWGRNQESSLPHFVLDQAGPPEHSLEKSLTLGSVELIKI
jgi:hypothetical protein